MLFFQILVPLLILCQLMQWALAVFRLHEGEFKYRRSFLKNLIPFYFIVCAVRFIGDLFFKFSLLQRGK